MAGGLGALTADANTGALIEPYRELPPCCRRGPEACCCRALLPAQIQPLLPVLTSRRAGLAWTAWSLEVASLLVTLYALLAGECCSAYASAWSSEPFGSASRSRLPPLLTLPAGPFRQWRATVLFFYATVTGEGGAGVAGDLRHARMISVTVPVLRQLCSPPPLCPFPPSLTAILIPLNNS